MKKLFMAVVAALLLLGGTMTVQASYDKTIEGVQCYCSITNNKKDVMAFTACGSTSTTVVIHSTAYDENGKAIGSSGNAGGGYAVAKYSASDAIACAIQDHEVPSYGFSRTLIAYGF